MFKPILDRILLKRIEEEDKSIIQTPDAFRQKSNKGEVVALGQFFQFGGQLFPMSEVLSVGDIVLFGEFNWQPVKIDEEEYLLVRIADLLGVEKKCGALEGLNETSVQMKFGNA